MANDVKRLYRSRRERMIGGVCGGLGEYLGTDPTVIRLATVLLTFIWPPMFVVYLIMLLIVPEQPLESTTGEPPATSEEAEPSSK